MNYHAIVIMQYGLIVISIIRVLMVVAILKNNFVFFQTDQSLMQSFKVSSSKKADAAASGKPRQQKDDFESALDSVAQGPARPRQRNDRLSRSFNDLRRSCE